ncbi:hypothetical protein FMM68_01995 [Lachnospiraceae bacterium MD329]|jgi:hypothetical protein|nr:hypothetical protein [Lachnospiraceae bacterium MD329]
MSQTKYKLDTVRRNITINFCKLYTQYTKSENELHNIVTRAIDKNKLLIACDVINEDVRQKVAAAIWESILNSKEYPYEVWNLPTISRNEFYERKRKFIQGIAIDIGI